MKTTKLIVCCILLALMLLNATSCVELLGQRICLNYDAQLDRLEILLFYDGIHESADKGDGNALEQIPKFVANGDIMLLDWPFHLGRSTFEDAISDAEGDPEASPVMLNLVKSYLQNVQTAPVGHYRDTAGRIGAAQLITINNASKLLTAINAAINESTAKDLPDDTDLPPKTKQLLIDAVNNNHQWITLDGNSLVVNIPADNTEWQYLKAEFMRNVIETIHADDVPANAIFAFANALTTYNQTDNNVTFRLGNPKDKTIINLIIRQTNVYNDNLEQVLIEQVPLNLQKEIVTSFIDSENKQTPPDIQKAIDFGPPELQVAALLQSATSDTPDAKQNAIKQLQAFAKQWQHQSGLPTAPDDNDDANAYLELWKDWYQQMSWRPLNAEQSNP